MISPDFNYILEAAYTLNEMIDLILDILEFTIALIFVTTTISHATSQFYSMSIWIYPAYYIKLLFLGDVI